MKVLECKKIDVENYNSITYIRIDPENLSVTIRDIITSLSNLSWIAKFDKSYIRNSFFKRAEDTAEYLADKILKDDGDKIVRLLKNQGIHSVDLLVITHFDKDHVGGAAKVLEHMEVNAVFMPDYEGTRPEYDSFLEALAERDGVQRLTVTTEQTIGEMKIRVQAAEQADTFADENDLSLVTWVTFGHRKFLFTGDITEGRISELLASDEDLRADWIKMPHHGRYEANLGELLDAVEPSYAVICCSNKHPASADTLKLLDERKIQVFDTSEEAVVTTCDGEHITEVKLQNLK